MVAHNIELPWHANPQYIGTYYFDPNLAIAPANGFFSLIVDEKKLSGLETLVRGRILDSVGMAEFDGTWDAAGLEFTKSYLRTNPGYDLSKCNKVLYNGSHIEDGFIVGLWNFIGVDKPEKPFIMASQTNFRYERFKQIFDSLNLRDI